MGFAPVAQPEEGWDQKVGWVRQGEEKGGREEEERRRAEEEEEEEEEEWGRVLGLFASSPATLP
jgi:hypothetical protein